VEARLRAVQPVRCRQGHRRPQGGARATAAPSGLHRESRQCRLLSRRQAQLSHGNAQRRRLQRRLLRCRDSGSARRGEKTSASHWRCTSRKRINSCRLPLNRPSSRPSRAIPWLRSTAIRAPITHSRVSAARITMRPRRIWRIHELRNSCDSISEADGHDCNAQIDSRGRRQSDAADSLAMLLEIGGHEVTAVYSASEALKRAPSSGPPSS